MNHPITCGPYRISEIDYEPGYRQATHWHAEAGITLVLAGCIRECVGRAEEFGSALSVVIKPAGVRHANEIGPQGSRTLQILHDPNDVTANLKLNSSTGWRWLHAQPVAGAMLALLRAWRDGVRAAELQDRIIEAVASIDDDTRFLTTTPPAWLQRIRAALHDEPASTFSLAGLAHGENLHAVTLSRAFRKCYGCTPTDYRRNVRLRRAAVAIEGSDRCISRIAHESGFADHPHLAREFRRASGLTPSEFRALARDVKSVQDRGSDAP